MLLVLARARYGRYWRKSAREPGAERELATIAIERLERLQLAVRSDGTIYPLAALARFALVDDDIQGTLAPPAAGPGPLFDRT